MLEALGSNVDDTVSPKIVPLLGHDLFLQNPFLFFSR
jgi:hypothetical protein